MGYVSCFSVDQVGRNEALAMFWKQNMDHSITGYSQNHIDLFLNDNQENRLRLSCLYGYPKRGRRKNSWDLIRWLASVSNLP